MTGIWQLRRTLYLPTVTCRSLFNNGASIEDFVSFHKSVKAHHLAVSYGFKKYMPTIADGTSKDDELEEA